jgi:hypothetical protein
MRKTTALHFVILCIILGLGTAFFLYAQGNPLMQFVIGMVTSIAYVLWGLVDHYVHHDLHQKVVVEYLLVGCIAIVILAIVLHS